MKHTSIERQDTKVTARNLTLSPTDFDQLERQLNAHVAESVRKQGEDWRGTVSAAVHYQGAGVEIEAVQPWTFHGNQYSIVAVTLLGELPVQNNVAEGITRILSTYKTRVKESSERKSERLYAAAPGF
jgi:hypothetical protein